MGALILDKEACRALIEYARSHIIEVNQDTFHDLKPVGDDPEHRVILGTYRIVFSFENNNGKFCRHLSVSTLKKGKFPSPEIVELIMSLFEFDAKKVSDVTKVWVEDNAEAINVIEIVH